MSLALWFWTLLTGSRQKAMLYEGRRLLGQERYTEALELYRQAAEGWPTSPEGFLGLSRTYKAMGLADEAKNEAAMGLALERIVGQPEDLAGRVQLAQGFWERGMPHLALEHAERAHKLAPEDLAVLKLAAGLYKSNRLYPRALAALKQALLKAPLDSALHRQKAALQKAMGERVEALKTEALAAALMKADQDPADLEALEGAVSHLNANHLRPQALQLVERSLAASPGQAQLHCMRGELLLDQEMTRDALQALEKAVSLDPLSQRAQWLLSKVYAKQGDQAKADRHRDLAERLDLARMTGDPVEGASILVQVLLQSGQAPQARQRAEALVASNPKDWRGYFALALVHQEQNQLAEALACLGQAAKLNPRNPGIFLNRADVYSRLGDPVEAISQARKAVAAAPRDPEVRRSLARILRVHGQTKPAQDEEELADSMAKRAKGAA